MTKICVVGSSNIDLIFRTSRLPKPGETLAGESWQQCFGGKGANQAVVAARLGAAVSMITCVGNDAFGEQTLENYQRERINTQGVFQLADVGTGLANILVDSQGQNCILLVAGANGRLAPAHLRKVQARIEEADILLCQWEIPSETNWEALRIAKSAGVKTIFNPAPAQPLDKEILPLIDLLAPNETELGILTNRPTETKPQVTAAAEWLLQQGVSRVLVTLGSRGSLLFEQQGEGSHQIPALAVKPVDTTGAGDCFLGSLAVYWASGDDLTTACQKAAKVSAYSVTREGTQPSFPHPEELEDWLKSQET